MLQRKKHQNVSGLKVHIKMCTYSAVEEGKLSGW